MSKRNAFGLAPDTWVRGDPIDDRLPYCSVMIAHSEVVVGDIDLAAEGFTQMFAGPEATNPTTELIAALTTPYDVDLIRRRDFDYTLLTQPAFIGGTFPDKHSPEWLNHAASKGCW